MRRARHTQDLKYREHRASPQQAACYVSFEEAQRKLLDMTHSGEHLNSYTDHMHWVLLNCVSR